MLDSDTSVGEKIKTLFREQGITIASINTAVGLLISTIVGFVRGSSNIPSKPPDTGVRGWVKNKLKALAPPFGKFDGKLGAALPGIIDSIVSWLFNLHKKATLFAAEHLWLLIVAVVVLIYTQRR